MRGISLNEEKTRGVRILEILTEIVVVAVFGLFIATYLFSSVHHVSKSMEPTIPEEATVFTNRLAYSFGSPKRFDVVTFRKLNEDSDAASCLTRRVIGLPGEEVRIERGQVYINGKRLVISDYISEITSDGIAETPIVLKSNEYFLLGDRPANSEDSRSTTVGAVKEYQIIGKAWLYAKSLFDFHFIH